MSVSPMSKRGQEVAAELIGTCDDSSKHASEEELNDAARDAEEDEDFEEDDDFEDDEDFEEDDGPPIWP